MIAPDTVTAPMNIQGTEMADPFELTTGELSRLAGVNQVTLRRYAKLGLVEFRQISNGFLTFRRSAAARVRALRDQRRRFDVSQNGNAQRAENTPGVGGTTNHQTPPTTGNAADGVSKILDR